MNSLFAAAVALIFASNISIKFKFFIKLNEKYVKKYLYKQKCIFYTTTEDLKGKKKLFYICEPLW